MKVDYKGLKFQNWMHLMLLCLFILIVLWALQFLFLSSFYESMKKSEIWRIGNQITEKCDSDDFNDILNEYAFKNNLRIVLFNDAGRIIDGFDGFNYSEKTRKDKDYTIYFPIDEIANLKQKLAENNSDRISYLNSDNHAEMNQAVYAAKFTVSDGSVHYLYISSPIPPIDSTLSVLKRQFVIVTIILFFLSLFASQLISRRMTVPIIKLTKSAEKIAKGNLNVKFDQSGFTEIQQLASTLSYATDELSKLDNYRKEFIANVSHDLRTPLTIIKFYGEMIRDVSGANPEKRTAHCNTIVKEADWLSGMVNEILELSKLESNNVQIIKTNFNISRCLRDTLCSFQVLSDKEGYVFETNIDEDLTINANEQYIKRVMYNLISNAVNYTGDDKLIKVSLKNADRHIRFEVIDTGSGIDQDKMDGIWERYYKSNEVHKRAVVGTGLGLSIVKHALELHDAQYGVISEKDNGSTFWFELKV